MINGELKNSAFTVFRDRCTPLTLLKAFSAAKFSAAELKGGTRQPAVNVRPPSSGGSRGTLLAWSTDRKRTHGVHSYSLILE
jgi:hypothetical protein